MIDERSEAEQLRHAWRVFVLIGGSTLLASLNYSLMFVSFADLSKSFDSSDAALSWVLTGFSITVTTMLIPAGWAADRYGRKRMFIIGFSTFTVGSAVVALSPVLTTLIGGRVLQRPGWRSNRRPRWRSCSTSSRSPAGPRRSVDSASPVARRRPSAQCSAAPGST